MQITSENPCLEGEMPRAT